MHALVIHGLLLTDIQCSEIKCDHENLYFSKSYIKLSCDNLAGQALFVSHGDNCGDYLQC